MNKSIITFPLVEKMTCHNCKLTLDLNKLYANMINLTEDAYGIPAVMIRCPVCKTIVEWETKCN